MILHRIIAEITCPQTWAELILVSIFLWCLLLLAIGFGA